MGDEYKNEPDEEPGDLDVPEEDFLDPAKATADPTVDNEEKDEGSP